MSLSLAAVRADTPQCEDRVHFNNAGAALMPEPVLQTVLDHLVLERGVGGYEAEAQAAGGLRSFYTGFARLLNAQPDEIAFIENASRAWQLVLHALPWQAGDRVLIHASEYGSNALALLQLARRLNLVIDRVPSDAQGAIDLEALRRMITSRTRLIALTQVPSQSGLINPAAEVGLIAREHGLFYLLDACQSVGQLVVDVQAIGCHALSGTGRKFLRGPRGTGFLYVSNAALRDLDPIFADLRSAQWLDPERFEWAPGARRFEVWESPVAERLGLAKAVDYALAIGMPAIESRVRALSGQLRAGLREAGVEVHDLGGEQCGIVTFRRHDEAPERSVARLAAAGFNTSLSVRASAQMDFAARGLDALVRASPHYYNSEHEVERFVRAVVAS